MITYAIALTAILFGIIGYLTCYLFEEEVKDVIRRRFISSKERRESKQMDQAVELVSDKLGGTVLPIDKVN